MVVDVRIGGIFKRVNFSYFGGNNFWVLIFEMNGGVIMKIKELIIDLGVVNFNVKLFFKGIMLLSFKLLIGKIVIVGKDLYINEVIVGFVFIDN